MSSNVRIWFATLAVCACVVVVGCKKKSPAIDKAKRARLLRDVPGLESVPKQASLVLSADVETLKKSVVVKRMVRQMLLRDPGLRTEFANLSEACEFDIEKDLRHVVVGMGGGDVVAVASGQFIQSDIASCLNREARASGGTFEAKSKDGRSYWYVEKQGHKRWLSVPASKTLVIATSEAWLVSALDANASVLDNSAMASLIGQIRHTSNLWGVSQVPASIGANLTKITGGQVKRPPEALRFTIDLLGGLSFRLDAMMTSDEDAKSVSTFMELTLKMAKGWNLGKLASKMKTTVNKRAVTIQLEASLEELKEIVSLIDRKAPHKQDKPGSEPRN